MLETAKTSLQPLIDQSPQGIGLFNQNSQALYANDALLRLLGYSSHNFPNLLDLIHPRAAPPIRSEWEKMIATKDQRRQVLAPLQQANGQWRQVQLTFVNQLNLPDIKAVCVYFDDQSKQRELINKLETAEDQFHSMERRLTKLLEYSHEGVGLADEQLKNTFTTKSLLQILGFSEDELKEMMPLNRVHTDDKQVVEERLREAMAQPQQPVPVVCRFRHRDNSWRWLNITLTNLFSDPDVRGLLVNVSDITQQREAQQWRQQYTQEVEAERARIKTVLASLTDGVLVVNRDSQVISVNPAALELAQLSLSEVIGQPYRQVFKFIMERSRLLAPLLLDEAMSQKVAKRFVNHTALLRPDGTSLPVFTSAAPIEDEHGEVVGGVMVFSDAQKERQLDQAKDVFLSIAAHQLRTPLGALRWNTEMLLRDEFGPLSDSQRQAIDHNYASLLRMVSLVNDLLNVTRIDQGRVKSEPKWISLNQVLTDMNDALTSITSQHNVRLEINIPENLPTFYLDEIQLTAVLENLLSNAIKYSPQEGVVQLAARQNDEGIQIDITDQGIGIPTADQDKIFTKFFRAENAVVSETEGTGLGLFVVKSFVENWGGHVWFTSKPGEGSVFTFNIPTTMLERKS